MPMDDHGPQRRSPDNSNPRNSVSSHKAGVMAISGMSFHSEMVSLPSRNSSRISRNIDSGGGVHRKTNPAKATDALMPIRTEPSTLRQCGRRRENVTRQQCTD